MTTIITYFKTKTLIFFLLLFSTTGLFAETKTFGTKYNPFTSKNDYYLDTRDYVYLNATKTSYFHFDGYQIFLYINGILITTWGTAAEERTIWYSGRQLIYGGRVLSR